MLRNISKRHDRAITLVVENWLLGQLNNSFELAAHDFALTVDRVHFQCDHLASVLVLHNNLVQLSESQ